MHPDVSSFLQEDLTDLYILSNFIDRRKRERPSERNLPAMGLYNGGGMVDGCSEIGKN